ncbi:MAG TPA: CHASE domain-containing protein [Steroidobacter sp.]
MQERLELLAKPDAAPVARGLPAALITTIVLVGGTILTGLAWRGSIEAQARHAREGLSQHLTAVASSIRDRMLAYEALLRAGVGVVDAFWPVSREQWHEFANEVRVAAVYPGLQGVGFAVSISSQEDLAHWTATLAPLAPNDLTELRTVSARLPESAIVFLEPLEDERNRRAIGYDMTSEPRRRKAMERARDTGRSALSERVVLVQDSRFGRTAAGFLLYLPVYEGGEVPATLEERRASLRGFVYSPFRAEDFFRAALSTVSKDVLVEVFDARSLRPDALLYRSDGGRSAVLPEDRLVDSRLLSFGGHEWTVRVSQPREMATSPEARRLSWVILAGGAATTLLLSGIVMSLSLSRQRLRERMLADRALAEREQQAAQVLENALEAYIAIDPNDTIVGWNRQAAALFGWSAHEAIGMRLADVIVPPDLRERHARAVTRFEQRSEHPLLNRMLEMPARRRDGTELTVELSIVKVSSPSGARFVASLRDVTQQRKQQAEIRRLAETLEQRVQERTAQLEVANRELSAANRDLEAFTYSVSHDLRAPLRAIDGHMLRLLELEPTMTEPQRHHAEAIRRSVARMNQLIDDLLDFAFVGRRPLEKERVVLWELVRSILQELHAPSSVVYEVRPDELGEVYADRALLKQALQNLLSNAVKFSHHANPPRIAIGSELTPTGRVYFVRDNGVGFDMQYAGKLFGVFERLHSSTEFEGTGVGLAIVKQVIERHGGRVWAESQPGQGATFRFTLP